MKENTELSGKAEPNALKMLFDAKLNEIKAKEECQHKKEGSDEDFVCDKSYEESSLRG